MTTSGTHILPGVVPTSWELFSWQRGQWVQFKDLSFASTDSVSRMRSVVVYVRDPAKANTKLALVRFVHRGGSICGNDVQVCELPVLTSFVEKLTAEEGVRFVTGGCPLMSNILLLKEWTSAGMSQKEFLEVLNFLAKGKLNGTLAGAGLDFT